LSPLAVHFRSLALGHITHRLGCTFHNLRARFYLPNRWLLIALLLIPMIAGGGADTNFVCFGFSSSKDNQPKNINVSQFGDETFPLFSLSVKRTDKITLDNII